MWDTSEGETEGFGPCLISVAPVWCSPFLVDGRVLVWLRACGCRS